MLIKVKKEMIIGSRTVVSGEIIAVEDNRAKALIEAGLAVYVPPVKEKPVAKEASLTPKAARNATKEPK